MERDSFIRKGVTGNTHQERSHKVRRDDSRRPGHVVSWTGHTTAPRASFSSTQHQSQSQLHRGPLANQPRSQWFIIARGRPETSSLHGNAALLRSQHHSTADDKITANKPRPHLSDYKFEIYIYIYIYIYVCVCVCVCVWYCSCHSNTTLQFLKELRECKCPKNIYELAKSYFSKCTAVMATNTLRIEKRNKKRMSTGLLFRSGNVEFTIQFVTKIKIYG